MQVRATWLEAADKQLIFEEALAILQRAGMRMSGSRAVALLADCGADVDPQSGIVRLPPDVVESALALCPREILMAGGSREQDVLLADGQPPRFCTGGCAARTLDRDTGEVRPSTLDDLRQAAALCDELDEVSVLFTPITATDLPAERRELTQYATLFAETAKHQILVDNPRQGDALKRIAEVLRGDLDQFRIRPQFSTLLTVASPLRVDGELLDFHASMSAIGAPVGIFPSPLSGATAPVTVAGTVTQALAEFLGAAAALQTMAPGARLLMGSIGSVLDMRTAMATFAAPEAVAISAMGAEMAHFLGLPVQCAGLGTSANYPGIQAGYEKALKGLAMALVGADMISGGIGLVESGNLFSLPQVVIDGEIAAMEMCVASGADVSSERIMSDSVVRVGVGGDFLSEKETARLLRAGAHFAPRISTRLAFDAWAARGRSEVETATEQIGLLLDAHKEREPYLTAEQLREIADICRLDRIT